MDRIVRVVAHDGTATLYEYDENGNRTAVRYANGTNFVSNGSSGLCSPISFSGSSRLEGVWYEYTSGDVTIITGTTMSIDGEAYSCSISGNQLIINSGDYYICFSANISGSELTLTDTSYNESYYFTKLY